METQLLCLKLRVIIWISQRMKLHGFYLERHNDVYRSMAARG